MKTMAIQRTAPFGKLRPQRLIPVPLERVNPLIRIAHRLAGPLHVDWRIIFDYEFVLLLSGQGSFETSTGVVDFGPGALFLIPPFQPHRLHSANNDTCEHIAVHFDFGRHAYPGGPRIDRRRPYAVLLEGGLNVPGNIRLSRVNPLLKLFERVVQAHAASTPLGKLEARMTLLDILWRLLTRPDSGGTGGDVVLAVRMQPVLTWFDHHLSERADLNALAALAGLSRAHFNRVFRRWTGYSPREYQQQRRIEKARLLLVNMNKSVKQVAMELGFADVFQFSRTFTRLDGLPPTEYRRMALAGRQGAIPPARP